MDGFGIGCEIEPRQVVHYVVWRLARRMTWGVVRRVMWVYGVAARVGVWCGGWRGRRRLVWGCGMMAGVAAGVAALV